MCGRFALFTPPDELARLFDAQLAEDAGRHPVPSYNVAPTSEVLGLAATPRPPGASRTSPAGTAALAGQVLGRYWWGLVLPWAKEGSGLGQLINARAETVASKPAFRAAFATRRMVVPADGFYEWQGSGKVRQPYYFSRPDGRPLALAGLWEPFRRPGPVGGPVGEHRSCAIVTTAAGPDMAGVYDRMPAILDGDGIDAWLHAGPRDRGLLHALLQPAPAGTLVRHRVDPRVGNVRNDDRELLEPISAFGE